MKKISWKVYATVLGIFLLGALCGALAFHGYVQREHRGLIAGERDAFERRRLRGLTHELDLTSEQSEKVAAIFKSARETRRKLTREAFERCGEPMKQHRERTDASIRAVLTPEQRERFDELRRRRPHEPPHHRH